MSADKKNYRKLQIVSIFTFFLILIIAIIMIVLEKSHPFFYITVLAIISVLTIVVVWHSKVTIYKCSNCGREFKISAFLDFISPHFPCKKLLKCPNCKNVSWCQVCNKS